MRVMITLDRYDGSASRTRTCFLEDVTGPMILRYMMDPSVCGMTITKEEGVEKAVTKAVTKPVHL